MNAPLERVFACRSRLPQDFEPDLPLQAFLIEDDLADNEAQDALALGRRRRRGMPDAGQIFAQRQQTVAVPLAQCVSAWNKDPVSGVIGIQKGPL